MTISFDELAILKNEIKRLEEKAEILSPQNFVERRELQVIIKRLECITHCKEDSYPPQNSLKLSHQLRIVFPH